VPLDGDSIDQGLEKAGSGSGGQLIPLKFGADIRNCMWCLRRTGAKVMAMTYPYPTNNQHDFKGWVKIDASCYVIKLDF